MRHEIEGKKSCVIVGKVVSWPLIHSIVVVTSPIGVQTPPALAATTTIAPNKRLSSSLGINFRRRETITIVTVRLFNMEERKKVKKPIIQNKAFLDFVVMRLVITCV